MMQTKMINPNLLCMGCMKQKPSQTDRCPFCGFSAALYDMQRASNSLPAYEVLNGKYLIGRVIGIGGFGITYLAWDLFKAKKVCIKEYFPNHIAVRNTHAETYTQQLSVSILCNQQTQSQLTITPERVRNAYFHGLQSYMQEAETLSKFYMMPGIVSIRDFFPGNQTAYIVMEFIEGYDMKHYAAACGGRLQPNVVFPLMKDVIKALDAVHQAHIIHRDISPDNIMIDVQKKKAKIIDFGAIKYLLSGEKTSVMLKHGYAPPEQYSRTGNLGPWTDVYSLCATIYYLLTGNKIPKASERVNGKEVPLLQSCGVAVPDLYDQAIQKGLALRVEDRFQSMEELYQALYGQTIE